MDLARKFAQLESRLEAVERASRLSSASLDDTALEVRDGDGSLRGVFGQQGDGTTAALVVNGPPPPQPSAPIVASVLGGVTASWDGQFTDGAVLPLDWSRTEVHASTLTGFTPDASTLQSTIETAQGATVVVPSDDPVYVRLLARSTSGTASAPSAQAGPHGPTAVVATDILDGIVTTVKLADDAVTAAKVATGAIGTTEITDSAVTTAKIVAGAVQTAQLDAEAVNASKIAAGAVTTLKLDALAVTADKIAANAITVSKLAAGSVDATALKADAITGKTITGGTVTGATVTGGIVQTGPSGQRLVLNPSAPDPGNPTATVPAVELHSGAAAQITPGVLLAQVTDDAFAYPYASLTSPAVASIGPGGVEEGPPINSELRLLSSQPGARGGSFSLDANPNPYNDASGKSNVYGYVAADTTDTSSLELVCFDGDDAPGGTGLLGPGTSIKMTGSVLEMRAQNATADQSVYFRPTGVSITGDLTIAGTSQARGYTAYQARSSATAAANTEQIALTQTGVVIKNGRAYQLNVRGLAINNTANTGVRIRIRRTNTSGAIWLDTYTVTTPNAGANYQYSNTNVVVNDTGADITTTLVMTWVSVAGGNSFLNTGHGFYTTMEVLDIGAAANFTTAQSAT